MSLAIVMAVTFLALWALIAWARRPHTVVRFKGADIELVRGGPPPALLDDLRDLARKGKLEAGTLALQGEGEGLRVSTSDFEGKHAQRVRNVVQLYRKQIKVKG